MNVIDKINEAKAGKDRANELVRQIRIELNRNIGEWARLARLSDGELTYSWIQQFAHGEIKRPHIDKAMILARFLGIELVAKEGQHYNRFS